MPELADPLGAPYIIKPDDWVHIAEAEGYSGGVLNTLPAMNKAVQSTTSLIDNAYNEQMAFKKSQADLAESAANTAQIGVKTDLLKQDYENRSQVNPILIQQQQNKLDSDKIALQQTQRNAQDQNDAIGLIPEATSALPNPDDPGYADKRDQWRIKYNRLLTNPATRARMEGEYQAVDSVYQGKISTQQTNDRRKEVYDLQNQGYIPSPLNPDKLVQSPDLDNYLTKGRMLEARHDVEMTAAQLPANDPNRQALQGILDETDKDTGSDSGVQDVMAGKSKVYDTNGRLTGVSQAALGQAQATIAAAAKQAGAEKPTAEVAIPFGKKGVMLTVKGVPPSVGEEWALKYGVGQNQTPTGTTETGAGASLIQDPAVRDLAGRYQRREITRDQFIEGLKKLPAPTAAAPTAAAGASTGASTRPTPTSNNDYQAPQGVGDTMGINRNVWQNVMSEEGAEFGKDGSHDSVFGLWADSPGTEGEAYQIAKQYGARSPQAYNAVTDAWTKKFLQQSQPWNLKSPGLQELVIADSQHVGGGAARAIIDNMGGFKAVNAMDPLEAIREYSEQRLPIWEKTNNAGRVKREMEWALKYNDELSGGSSAQANLSSSDLPRPSSVAEARGLPRGSHFIDPDGNRRMVA